MRVPYIYFEFLDSHLYSLHMFIICDIISAVTCDFCNFQLFLFLCVAILRIPHPLNHCNIREMISNLLPIVLLLVFFKNYTVHHSWSVHSSILNFLPPLLLCSSEVRWNHQMMILSASAPVLVSHPFGVSVRGGHCPHALQDLWDFLETHCHGTCPNMRGGRGRVKTPYLTQQKELWFVLQVKKSILFRVKYPWSLNMHLLRCGNGRLYVGPEWEIPNSKQSEEVLIVCNALGVITNEPLLPVLMCDIIMADNLLSSVSVSRRLWCQSHQPHLSLT